MCGLKLELDNSGIGSWWSHPAWVCGLKQRFRYRRDVCQGSHPAWVCGLKQISWIVIIIIINVTPCVGVWIETFKRFRWVSRQHGHTLRGCVDWNRLSVEIHPDAECHTLRGCVDWNTQSTTIIARMNCHTLRGCIWIEALFTRWSSLWKNCKHSASCVFLFKLL